MEDKRGGQIFAACAAGGGVGALVSLQLSQVNPLMAALGGFVGMLVGYLAYDPAGVFAAFKQVFLKATAWRPGWARIRQSAEECAMLVGAAFTPLLVVSALMYYDNSVKLNNIVLDIVISTYFCGIYIFGFWFLMSVFIRDKSWDIATVFKWGNPLTVLCLPVIGLYWLIITTPAAISFSWQVTKSAFILMHSNGRVLCAVDSLIGACVGYLAGNAMVGAIVGGGVGLLNYELVSKRWLKLVPAPVEKK